MELDLLIKVWSIYLNFSACNIVKWKMRRHIIKKYTQMAKMQIKDAQSSYKLNRF